MLHFAHLDSFTISLDSFDSLVQLGGVLPRRVVEGVAGVVLRGRDGPHIVARWSLVFVAEKTRGEDIRRHVVSTCS